MNFYSAYGLVGDLLFKNARWTIGFINESAFGNVPHGDIDAEAILNAASISGLIHSNGKLKKVFAARQCCFLAVSNNPFDYNLTKEDLSEIEAKASTAGMGTRLGKLWSEIKAAKDGDTLDARTVFNAAHVKDDVLTYGHSQLNPAGVCDFSVAGDTFTVSNPRGNTATPNGICFSNAFEMIYVPLDDKEKALAAIKRIVARSEMTGRVSTNYVVIPIIWDEPQATIRVRELDNMTTKEMVKFFRSGRKGSTKIDTIKACLGSWAKFVPFMEEGNIHFIQLNTKQPESPLDVEPIDWILAQASHMEIMSSEQPEADTMNIFVRISENPSDDFASALYALFESQKKAISIISFSGSKMETMFDELRSRVAAATSV